MFHLLFWSVVLATFLVMIALFIIVSRLLHGRWVWQQKNDDNSVRFVPFMYN